MNYIYRMIKRALSIDDQLELMKRRGLVIGDDNIAKDVLSVIGYYRLGFYLFPFEKSYPDLNRRTHVYKPGSNFIEAVKLYYFDLELRTMLLKYISSVEVYFRAVLTYEGSMMYRFDPVWFVNPLCVTKGFISDFDRIVYNGAFRKNPTIKRHHKKYKHDVYAPAWKTIELMTLGGNVILYNSLLDMSLKQKIAEKFGVRYIEIFENYIELVRILRNTCAHGSVLFDFKPFKRIKKGPAGLDNPSEYMNLYGCIKVVRYLLFHVSEVRDYEMAVELQSILDKYNTYPQIADILRRCSGFPADIFKEGRRVSGWSGKRKT